MDYKITLTSVLALSFGLVVSGTATATEYTIEGTSDAHISENTKTNITNSDDTLKIKYADFDGITSTDPTGTAAIPDGGGNRGGAINSTGSVEITSSNFSNNAAKPSSGYAYGGALHLQRPDGDEESGLISDSTFTNNMAISENSTRANGGAIYSNRSNIAGIINSKFIGNLAQTNSSNASDSYAAGGAINFNGGYLKKLDNVLFDGNKTISTGNSWATGGAMHIFSAGLGDITNTTFSNSSATSQGASGGAFGGAIYLGKDTWGGGSLSADFINNYVESKYQAAGGAIYGGTSDFAPDITGTFSGNYVKAVGDGKIYAYGGAIYSLYKLGNISASFIGNHTIVQGSTQVISYGGAIYNYGGSTAGNITNSLFKDNYIDISTTTAGSKVYSEGAAILNEGTIGNISGRFENNYIKASSTTGNIAARGGAISSYAGVFGEISADFIGNNIIATSDSGNIAAYGAAVLGVDTDFKFKNSNFINNTVTVTTSGQVISGGGAIYLDKDTTLMVR